MAVTHGELKVERLPDEYPDPSYLDQDELRERYETYRRGGFGFIGIRASTVISIPFGENTWITQKISSPGLWGIEDDSDQDYLDSIGENEKDVLREMLAALGAHEKGS